jgi:hypothetical protein
MVLYTNIFERDGRKDGFTWLKDYVEIHYGEDGFYMIHIKDWIGKNSICETYKVLLEEKDLIKTQELLNKYFIDNLLYDSSRYKKGMEINIIKYFKKHYKVIG